MNFASDNAAGISPPILEAMLKANAGYSGGYGNDDLTKRVEAKLNEIFEREVTSFLVTTGTAANALALSNLTPSHGLILTPEHAHIMDDECGAVELQTAGARLVGVDSDDGKLSLTALEAKYNSLTQRKPHGLKPSAISFTQSTETGLVYSHEETMALCNFAHQRGLKTHLDGARFGNALAKLKCSPASLTWQAGIDVLSFGATKGGAMGVEAVIFFDKALAENFDYKRKRAGHLISKHRFLAAQMLGFLENDHWLVNAAHANNMASLLAKGLNAKGIKLTYDVQANSVFAILAPDLAQKLISQGATFYPWPCSTLNTYRFVTSFLTQRSGVEAFLKLI